MKTYTFSALEAVIAALSARGFQNIECANVDNFDWSSIQSMDAVIGNLTAAQVVEVCARGTSYYELILNNDGSVKNLTQLTTGEPYSFSGEIKDLNECCDKYTFPKSILDRSRVECRLSAGGIDLTLHSADEADDLEVVVEHIGPSVGNPAKWRIRFGRTLEDFNYCDIGDVEVVGDSLEVFRDD